MGALKRMFSVLLAGVLAVSVSAHAIRDNTTCDKIKAYMHQNYMQGLHNSAYYIISMDCDYCSHDVFLKDMEQSELVRDFKLALNSVKAREAKEAKETYKSVLKDFERCLEREKRCESIVQAELYSHSNQGRNGTPGYRWHQKLQEVTKAHSKCEILTKRIEVWSQLLPDHARMIKAEREKEEVILGVCVIVGAIVYGIYRYFC